MNIIYKGEKKHILEQLEQQYGITKIPHLFLRFGKDKIRGYTGALSMDEINLFEEKIRIELLGIYLFNKHPDGMRLSLDAIHIFKDQITKNIIELTDKQAEEWFRGEDLLLTEEFKKQEKTYKVLKNKGDFIGCGKLSENRLINYLPKERRIR